MPGATDQAALPELPRIEKEVLHEKTFNHHRRNEPRVLRRRVWMEGSDAGPTQGNQP
jgi:hypothetical protein